VAAAANEDVDSVLTAAEGTTENDVILVASNPREAELWELCDSFTGACELMSAGARTSDDAYAECVTLLRAISSVEDLKIVEGRLPSSANVWGKSLFFNRLITSATEHGISLPQTQNKTTGVFKVSTWSTIQSSARSRGVFFGAFKSIFGDGSNPVLRIKVLMGAAIDKPKKKSPSKGGKVRLNKTTTRPSAIS